MLSNSVVVGTVIDPEMTDELKVTVVATGLGAEKLAKIDMAAELELPQMEIVKKHVDIDYDKPTVLRNEEQAQKKQVVNVDNKMDYLDVPAFLRRQAD